MAQVTVYATAIITNWDTALGWNSQADGLGTNYTNPQNGGGTTYDCVLNNRAVTLNVDVTVDAIRAPASDTGTLTVSGTRIITVSATNGVAYGHTLTTGMVIVPTGTNINITSTGGAGTNAVTNTSTGHCVVSAGTAIVSFSNSGGVALNNSGAGRAFNPGASGAVAITGDIQNSGSGQCVQGIGACTVTFAGNVISSNGNALRQTQGSQLWNWTPGSGASIQISGGTAAISWEAGTLSILGNFSTSNTATLALANPINITGGTVVWTGSRTLAASADCVIRQSGGTLTLASVSAALELANSGTFVIYKSAGTLNTANVGAGAASIKLQNSTSYAAILGGTNAQKSIISSDRKYFLGGRVIRR